MRATDADDGRAAGSFAEPGLLGNVPTLAVTNPLGYVTLRRHWCQRCHEVGLGTLTRRKNDPGQRWPRTIRAHG